jgi:CRISPR-associated exonuclease Cas4
MLLSAAILFVIGLVSLWYASRRQVAGGLPSGKVIYIDTEILGRQEQTLFDPHSGLSGRPDYILREEGQYIPVEIKSRTAPLAPFPSHLVQLAAYCYLVQSIYGKRPPHGVIKYRNRSFAVDYDQKMEDLLLDTLETIRACDDGLPSRSHSNPARCRSCGYRDLCEERLN